MAVTIKDIAQLAGVSFQAVSATLNANGSSRVSQAKRDKIISIARELNYVPNTVARSLVGGRTGIIGIIGGAAHSIWNNLIAAECSEYLLVKGYTTLISHYMYSDYSHTAPHYKLIRHGIDGLIILNSEGEKAMSELDVPRVFGSHYNKCGYDVGIDNKLTGYIGARHLLEHGHAKVLYLNIKLYPGDERIRGWRLAHQEKGVEINDDHLLSLNQAGGSFETMMRTLKKLKITAIFASNDYVAGRTMRYLSDQGIRIPEDIAIIGCDGASFTEFCRTPLATVQQPIRSQVEKMVELLLARIKNKELNSPLAGINIEPKLLSNASCGCPARPLTSHYRLNSSASIERDFKLNFNQNQED